MGKLLTRRKERWVKQRQPNVVSGKPLNNPSILEERYARTLEAMVDKMCDDVLEELKIFFMAPTAGEYFDSAQDASISVQAKLFTNQLMKRFNQDFAKRAPVLAERQTKAVSKASSASLYASLQEMSGGLSLSTTGLSDEIWEVFNASVIEQTSLIKSISMEYLGGVAQATQRSIASGRGLADLQPYLEKHKGITYRRARMIAHDQTRKAYNNLNRARLEKLGLKKYQWIHTGGGKHPRELHVRYGREKAIFSFDDPPIIDENTGERGIPGQAINCRCTMKPVIDFGDE